MTKLVIVAAIILTALIAFSVWVIAQCLRDFGLFQTVCLLTFARHPRPALASLLIPSLKWVVFADPSQAKADLTIGIYQLTNSSVRSARNFL